MPFAPCTRDRQPGIVTVVVMLAIAWLWVLPARAACTEKVGRDIPVAAVPEQQLALPPLTALNEAIDKSQHDVRALLIVRGCKLVFERYKHGITREHRQAAYSVTKSIVSTQVGMAIKQGLLASPQVRVGELLDRPKGLDVQAWYRVRDLQLADFMGMRSGLEYLHDPRGHPIYRKESDRVEVALGAKVVAAPGTRFNYSDGDASVSGAMAAAAYRTTLLEAVQNNLWKRLQAQPIEWFGADAAGRFPGGWATHARPMDLAKFGLLHLYGGSWNGEALIDASYAKAVWTAGPNTAYGLGWWIGDPERYGTRWYMANGNRLDPTRELA